MTEEPSVLDYLKAKLTPWRGPAPQIPSVREIDEPSLTPAVNGTVDSVAMPAKTKMKSQESVSAIDRSEAGQIVWPWRAIAALGVALIAQWSLEPGVGRSWIPGLVLYLLSFGLLAWASRRSEYLVAQPQYNNDQQSVLSPPRYVNKPIVFLLTLSLAMLAFLTFGGNRFNTLNVSLWILSIIAFLVAFWDTNHKLINWTGWGDDRLSNWRMRLTIPGWTVLLVAVSLLIIFFRLYRLDFVPPEMVSDHAEKLLDVWDVLHGKTSIFFPRNTGREGLQMYMTAGIIQILGTGYSHLSLKIGTVIAGLLTLPFIYLLGKEMGNRRVGLFALLFAGIAYWPNVISRVGLRFPLYPLFVAPALYFLLRGLRTTNRNYFILSGIFLGIGLHGYTPIRILPIVILIAVGIYLLHPHSQGKRQAVIWGLVLLVLVSFLIFLPLLRYAIEDPYLFSFRSFSRMGSVERPLPGPAWQIFLTNLWNAMIMFAWDNGEIWVHSVPNRPALDIVSAALFYLGGVILFIRYIRKGHWLDLFLLLSVPLLMMPSILSLAFPSENPSLNRMSGAVIPVFLFVAIALDSILAGIESRFDDNVGKGLAWGLGILLVLWASFQNYDLVFNQYQRLYQASSWNTSEMGEVIRDFTQFMGSPESAYVVAFPHWVDTRLVGMNAGFPLKDFAIAPEAFKDTAGDPQVKLFLIKPEDEESVINLRHLYPQGILNTYVSEVSGHDFLMFIVPADG